MNKNQLWNKCEANLKRIESQQTNLSNFFKNNFLKSFINFFMKSVNEVNWNKSFPSNLKHKAWNINQANNFNFFFHENKSFLILGCFLPLTLCAKVAKLGESRCKVRSEKRTSENVEIFKPVAKGRVLILEMRF